MRNSNTRSSNTRSISKTPENRLKTNFKLTKSELKNIQNFRSKSQNHLKNYEIDNVFQSEIQDENLI